MAKGRSESEISGTGHLHKAKRNPIDEFYTLLPDIENEMRHYRKHFRNKIIYCNCDDPFESNFFRFFAANFRAFKLKKLIATRYSGSPLAGETLPLFKMPGLKKDTEAYKIEINDIPDMNNDGAIDLADVELLLKSDANVSTPLRGPGDFKSEECAELLKEADIVVTNPPWSLFREYIEQLMDFKKRFIVIGNLNASFYSDISPLIIAKKIWLGVREKSGMRFKVPESYTKNVIVEGGGGRYTTIGNAVWYTNLKHNRRNEKIYLSAEYEPSLYKKYDNYDAIEVSRIADIPCDYDGKMGVPLSFLQKHNPEQFELVGFHRSVPKDPPELGNDLLLDGKTKFARIIIKHRQSTK